jgi:hypothetical protein
MDWLKQLAPLLGTAIGGPLGGVAASFIAGKLGVEDSSVTAMTDLLSSGSMSPDQVTALKLAEVDFKKFLETNKIDLAKIDLANTQGAREMMVSTKSTIPAALSIVVVVGFFGILISMMLGWLVTTDSQALMTLLSALQIGFGMILNFWFGSSNGSQNKDALLAQKG